MSENLNVELSERERDLLLRGLRYVRSSVLLQPLEPSPVVDDDRSNRLREISTLVDYLNGAATTQEVAKL